MAIGRRMRWLVVLAGLALLLGHVAPSPSWAAPADGTPPSKILWSNVRSFRLPVVLSSKNAGLVRELILYVSDDHGSVWKKSGRTTPDSPEFPVRVPRDGEYWFAVQTIDVNGKLYPPPSDKPIDPTVRVIVDSTKPTILLEPISRRGSEAGVRWEVQDAHLVLKTLTLEYQSEGASQWRQVPLDSSELKLIGVKNWDAGTPDTVRARLSVRDKAGNVQTVEQILPDGLAANPAPPVARGNRATNPPQVTPIAVRPSPTPSAAEEDFAVADEPNTLSRPANEPPANALPPSNDRDFDPPAAAPAASQAPRDTAPAQVAAGPTLLVGSPRFPLRYEVEDAGPDGPGHVVLWTTRDGGRTWSRQPEDADKVSPYNVDLGGEGTFGLWLEVQSSSGLGDPPPAPGDRPQSWVEVDSSPPAVSIDRPRVGSGAHAGKVLISWRAGDSHLAVKPISLFYRADRPDAPWVPIAQNLDNTGRYTWVAPPAVPPKFHLKVEAADSLGNHGSADTQDLGPVVIDRARPRGRIIGLEVGAGTARQ